MEKITYAKAKKLLLILQNFIISEVIPDDERGKREITELFQQLFDLIDRNARQGG